jgi:hypothetical protein
MFGGGNDKMSESKVGGEKVGNTGFKLNCPNTLVSHKRVLSGESIATVTSFFSIFHLKNLPTLAAKGVGRVVVVVFVVVGIATGGKSV